MSGYTLLNLTPEAADDLEHILELSLQWGSRRAAETRQRLVSRCQRIGEGEGLGHKRPDIPTSTPVMFVADSPLMIAYNPETNVVLRILDGRRDLRRLFDTQKGEN